MPQLDKGEQQNNINDDSNEDPLLEDMGTEGTPGDKVSMITIDNEQKGIRTLLKSKEGE